MVVPTKDIVNVYNYSHSDPSAHSVFIDLFDGEGMIIALMTTGMNAMMLAIVFCSNWGI